MANFLYTTACEKLLNGQISWANDTFKVVALTGDYVVNENAHTSLADIPSTARVGTSAALGGKSVTGGVARANPASFTNLILGKSIRSMVIFKQNTGVTNESQMDLICYIDTGLGLTDGITTQLSTLTLEWAGADLKKIFGKN